MKKILLIVMISLFSLNISGCEGLDDFSLMPEEENSVEEAEEKNTSGWFSVEIPSEVYGVEFENANFYGKFDSEGNTIIMYFEKK